MQAVVAAVGAGVVVYRLLRSGDSGDASESDSDGGSTSPDG